MPEGLYRIRNGWGGKQDSVAIRDDDGHIRIEPVSFYLDRGYLPNVRMLPYQDTDDKDADQKRPESEQSE
jgi:hypothetical protein